MMWLNTPAWRALQPGQHLIADEVHDIVVVDCGDLVLSSGRLVAADPFVTLTSWNRYYLVPPGAYPVRVTIDETIEREMYVSLILAPTSETERRLSTRTGPMVSPIPSRRWGAFMALPWMPVRFASSMVRPCSVACRSMSHHGLMSSSRMTKMIPGSTLWTILPTYARGWQTSACLVPAMKRISLSLTRAGVTASTRSSAVMTPTAIW